MKKSSVILVILFIISGIFYYHLVDDKTTIITGKVTRIIDGDTLQLENNQKIRLKGINTMETGDIYSDLAKNFLQEEVLRKEIKIINHGTDKYGRTLGTIFLQNENINKKILSNGLATLYYYETDTYYEEMQKAEEFARLNNLGIWQKSPNTNCITLKELNTEEPESLTLQNSCNQEFELLIKDDATHIYKETIKANNQLKLKTSHIWNDDGDTLYVYDTQGLLIFHRYP